MAKRETAKELKRQNAEAKQHLKDNKMLTKKENGISAKKKVIEWYLVVHVLWINFSTKGSNIKYIDF